MENEIGYNEILNFAKYVEPRLYISRDKIGTHTINRENVDKLIKNINEKSCMNPEEIGMTIEFLNRLLEIFIYIDFNTYMDTVRRVSGEIIYILQSSHTEYENIYFEANDSYDKSNTWVLLLCILQMQEFFRSRPDISEKIKIVNTREYVKLDKKTLWFYFDDMSYSGRQIALSIPEPNNNLDLYIVPMYLTNIARETILQQNNKVKFLENTIIVPNIRDAFLNGLEGERLETLSEIFKRICGYGNNIFYNSFQCYEGQSPVYFDHKIADGLSTFQKLLTFGIYPIVKDRADCVPECNINNLINGCGEIESSWSSENIDIFKTYCEKKIIDLDESLVCPQVWYKQADFYNDYPHFSEIDKGSSYNKKGLVQIIKEINNTYGQVEQIGGSIYKLKYQKYKEKYLALKKKLNK